MSGSPQPAQSSKPKVADLFAGVGGFSLGAARAGFDVAIAIDLDPHAIESHKTNFPKTTHVRRNIAKLSGKSLLEVGKLDPGKLSGIIGGPPCQGFSTMGRRRKNDSRNPLFFHFFRVVSEAKPSFFVAENVPGILALSYENLRKDALELVSPDYDILEPFTMCASDHGAATIRPRVFFVGFLKTLAVKLDAPQFRSEIIEKRSVKTAFSGLTPKIRPTWQTEQSSWRRINAANDEFFFSVNQFCEDIGDPKALQRFVDKLEVSGFLGTQHNTAVVERFASVLPGRMDKTSKFPRLRWDGLCPTLRAGTDHRKGSYQAVRPIHPDENRVITPREAARLQAFPDWFQFSPTKWHSFRQIGNSVSPFVSEAVMKIIYCKVCQAAA